MLSSKQMFDRRRRRNRTVLKKKSAGLPRLAVPHLGISMPS